MHLVRSKIECNFICLHTHCAMHCTSNFPSNWHTCLSRLTWPRRKFWTNLKSKVTDDEMSGHKLQHSPRIRKSNFRISLASPHLPTLDRGGVQVQQLSNETWITIFTSDFPPQLCLNIGVIFPYNTKSQSLLGQQGVCLACGGLLITIQLREPFPIQLSQLPDELETKFYFSAAS